MATSQQAQQTQQLLDNYFEKVGQQKAEALAALFTEELEFYIMESPYMPWTGKRTRQAELSKAFQALFDAHVTGEGSFKMEHTFIDENEAAVFGTAGRTVRATGKSYAAPFSMRFTFENGLIRKFTMFEDSHRIEKAFMA